MMADEKEAVAPPIGPKNGREHSIALDIMEGLKEDGLGTLEIAAVVGRLQLLVLDRSKAVLLRIATSSRRKRTGRVPRSSTARGS